jgi:hypothetical protein
VTFRRNRVAFRIGAAVTALLAVAVTAAVAPAPATAAKAKTRSGMPWLSGAFIPGDQPAWHEVFGLWRGAPTDIAVTYIPGETWDDIVAPAWLYGSWKDAPQTISIGTPLLPKTGATLAACAKGTYDANWRKFGSVIADVGVASKTILRLGWELNGNWQPWAATDPALFAACWRRVFKAVESEARAVRWDFNVNRGLSSANVDPREAYPGDAYVDIVGIDSFDGYPPATTEAGWKAQYAGTQGLKFWADFARQHRKKLSVPEWGVYPGPAWGANGGGDNAAYVAKMFEFFRSQADILAYESYFNEDAAYQAGALQLNPKAGAEYRKQLGAVLAAAKG